MRITIETDDELLEKAYALSGFKDTSSIIREALKVFVERESARRLARLGGTEPEAKVAYRRRPHGRR